MPLRTLLHGARVLSRAQRVPRSRLPGVLGWRAFSQQAQQPAIVGATIQRMLGKVKDLTESRAAELGCRGNVLTDAVSHTAAQASEGKLPYENASFDVVVLGEDFHKLAAPRRSIASALEEAHRLLRPSGVLVVTATRWAQRRSNWMFRLLPESAWEKLAANDSWTCYERTEENPETFTQVAHRLGFNMKELAIPADARSTVGRADLEAALSPAWRAQELSFAELTADEDAAFLENLQRELAKDDGASLLQNTQRRQELHGESSVYCFERLPDETFRANQDEVKAFTPARRTPNQGNLSFVNLVSGRQGPCHMQKLTPYLGGVAKNVDLSDPDSCATIRQGLWDHGGLLIPASEVCFGPNAHMELAKLWGPLEEAHPVLQPHPDEPCVQILPTNGGTVGHPDAHLRCHGRYLWHSDNTFRPNPSAAGLLCAQILPPCGGATMVTDTHQAYLRLPKDVQELLLQMTGTHDIETGYRRVGHQTFSIVNGDKDGSKVGGSYTSEHPAVIAHYATGKPHLFINSDFTMYISGAGLSEKECQEVFDLVCAEIDNPEYHVAVNWQEVESGSMLIWDNLAVQHMAPNDYAHFRLMHRCVVLGPGQPQAYRPAGGGSLGFVSGSFSDATASRAAL